jgi:hypothetical protein
MLFLTETNQLLRKLKSFHNQKYVDQYFQIVYEFAPSATFNFP